MAGTGDDGPDLVAVLMAVVVHAVAGGERDLDGHARVLDVEHAEGTPGLFGKHDLLMDAVHIRLDVTGLLLVRDQNALRAGRDDDVLQPHAEHGHVQLVQYMDVLAGVVQHGLADARLLHGLGQGVPGAHILPLARKAHYLNLGLILDNGVVEADFFQRLVLIEQVLVIGEIDQFVGLVQHVAQFVGKHTAVPERTLGNVLFGGGGVGLLFKRFDRADGVGTLRDNVAVLFARVGRFNAHQGEVRVPLPGQLGQGFQRGEIVIVDIGVYRADDDSLIKADALDVVQVGCRQCDGWEGITAARLDADAHRIVQLVVNGRYLRLAGGNRHAGVGVDLLDLAVDALDHRLVPVGGLEDFDELLGTNVVRQRPQALAGAAGQQDDIHSVSFQRSARIGLFRKSS